MLLVALGTARSAACHDRRSQAETRQHLQDLLARGLQGGPPADGARGWGQGGRGKHDIPCLAIPAETLTKTIDFPR